MTAITFKGTSKFSLNIHQVISEDKNFALLFFVCKRGENVLYKNFKIGEWNFMCFSLVNGLIDSKD
jgi:hypothetical protein